MTFATVEEFRDVIRTYNVASDFMIHQTYNDKIWFRGFCKIATCPWKIVAFTVEGGPIFNVRSFVKMQTYE